jgi:ATP-dependent DNA helicase RecG
VSNGFEGEVTIIGKVANQEKVTYGKKELFKVHMRDSQGFFECVWFQGIKYFEKVFHEGDHFAISGRPVVTRYGSLQFTHPDFDKITEDESKNFLNTGHIIPVYRVPKELRATNIGDLSIRRIVHTAVEQYADELTETLPHEIIERHSLCPIIEAVKNIHFPASADNLDKSKYRFKFEELFYIETLVALRRHNIRENFPGYEMPVRSKLIHSFLASLPFELTKAQLKVLSEIRQDMSACKPMNRLLQGDVGSGKTIVALIAMLIAKDNGFQSVLMAPTEILADQHYKKLSHVLEKLGVNVTLLIGGQTKKNKIKNLENIESAESDIVIGTHALLDLGLIVIDEQHRFGVMQRSGLIQKGHSPDVLIMTATPIPRTLSMTVYGDLDVSVIDEMPKDRKEIRTYLRPESKLPGVYEFIKSRCAQGEQAFIIFPLVEESEKSDLKAAETYYAQLKAGALSDLRVGLIHGKMKWQLKEETMLQFAQKEFDVLVATTVIEVGIDIPDATIMVINDSHQFGLSQLHQLRGRVGRSHKQSYCILITHDEKAYRATSFNFNFEYLSPSQIEQMKSSIRMQAMVKYISGFDISEVDMRLRGPGDIFGTKQSGFPDFKYADIIEDQDILTKAKQEAFAVIENDPHLRSESNQIIRKNLIAAYSDNLRYAKIG